MKKHKKTIYFILSLSLFLLLTSFVNRKDEISSGLQEEIQEVNIDLDSIPQYSGKPYVVINNNIPYFDETTKTDKTYESYSNLDELGRCGTAIANIGIDLMPKEERGSIGSVKPSGWKTSKYDMVEGKYLYNRAHLIGFQLTGENANPKNLITGTRYLNVKGMLPFENMVADYIKETKNNVLYRVTPIFKGDNLVANGVLMEAKSVQDNGEGILFNVYCYNVQPGIEINYKNGENKLKEEIHKNENKEEKYILNTSSKKYHKPNCPYIKDIKEKNKKEYTGTKENLEKQGYKPCHSCIGE